MHHTARAAISLKGRVCDNVQEGVTPQAMNLCEALDSEVPLDKVVLVGNPGVGKSTIFQRFKTGRFVREQELTHHDKEGQEYQKVWDVGDEEVSVSLDLDASFRHQLHV